ncbi:MAG: tRNA lysidine(34) synthetase TilS [Candidatus Omnitrophota bacterium]|jgi:tRNA(Ile)-lysidine synthase
MNDNLTERILKTARNYSMLKPGDVVLAAVSGGPDSVYMLNALLRLKNKFRVKEVIVCNMDHGLRGKESKEDSLFVKRLAKELGLKFIYKKLALKGKHHKELSLEEMAREKRYDFFKKAAHGAGANVIATGHTLDDQAETVLMRLIKGSSLKGIVGISPVREEAGLMFIRPLIEIEKAEIMQCLEASGTEHRIDRTNLEDIYFRNIVRGKIIPFLEKYNPRLKRVLFNLAEHLREDFEFITDAKNEAGRGTIKSDGKSVKIDLKDIAVQPRTIQKEILRDMLDKSGGLVKKLSFRHWKEMETLIRHKGKGRSIDLPGGIRITKTDRSLIFAGTRA